EWVGGKREATESSRSLHCAAVTGGSLIAPLGQIHSTDCGLRNAECGMAFVPNSAFFFLLRLRQRNESSSGFQMRVRDGEPHSTGGGSDPAHSIAPITQAPGRYSVLTRTT